MQLVAAFGLTCATVFIHALGTTAAIAYLGPVWRRKAHPGLWASGVMIIHVVSTLLLLHLAEAGVWAVFFIILGLLPDMETAIYFSITSYTTVGYGDVTLTAPWLLLGPMEAAVGILMFGWSTGIMVAVISRIHTERISLRTDQQTEGEVSSDTH